MQAIALGIVLGAAVWLAFVGAVCIGRPAAARATLSRMGSTWPIHVGEHLLRGIVGVALVVRAPATAFSGAFALAGWFLVASSLAILLAPRRWHHAFSAWWAERIPLAAWRVVGGASIGAAGVVAWAAT